jgi:hypothetical protein
VGAVLSAPQAGWGFIRFTLRFRRALCGFSLFWPHHFRQNAAFEKHVRVLLFVSFTITIRTGVRLDGVVRLGASGLVGFVRTCKNIQTGMVRMLDEASHGETVGRASERLFRQLWISYWAIMTNPRTLRAFRSLDVR